MFGRRSLRSHHIRRNRGIMPTTSGRAPPCARHHYLARAGPLVALTTTRAFHLATIRERIGRYVSITTGPDRRGSLPPVTGRSVDALAEHLRRAYGLDEGAAGGLALIRRGAVYACTTLRADMLSGLPIRLYRVAPSPAGRAARTARTVNLRNPRTRYGMPRMVGGRRVAEYGEAEEVESAPVLDLLARPNQDWVGRQLIRMTELGLGLVGQSHWQLHRGDTGTARPTGMSWLKHSRLDVIKPGDRDAPESAQPARTVAGWRKDAGTAGAEVLLPGEIVWMRYPDPDDPDYGALSPAGIAATGAHAYHDALSSNRKLFRDGLRAAGAFLPPEDMGTFDWPQADEITRDVNALLRGAANEHKTPVFPYRLNFQPFGVSPRDAEFVALMDFAIEDVARAYRIPIEMVGGTRRTYQNAEVADVALWQRALEPEAAWLADEMTMKLIPAFGLDPREYFLAFDLSGVVALQSDETMEWNRQREQIATGVLLPSEWRASAGLPELETQGASIEVGKVGAILSALTAMGMGQVTPESVKALIVEAIGLSSQAAAAIVGAGPPALPEPEPESAPTQASLAAWLTAVDRDAESRAPEFGSDEHVRIMSRAADVQKPHAARLEAAALALMRRQLKSVVDALEAAERGAGDGTERQAADWVARLTKAFGRARWIREFRTAWRGELRPVYRAGGDATAGEFDATFDAGRPAVIRALERQAQMFATSVNDTTWQTLKARLGSAIADGTANEKNLAPAVKEIMGDMLRSRPETIARTETHRAFASGSRLAAAETGLALNKVWMSALDSRVRDDHAEAHGQTVALDEDFTVGGATGPGPGEMGDAGQDINCFPAGTMVSAVGVERVYRRWYEGELVELTTALGHKLTGTPNHPVQSYGRWIGLGSIAEGDDIIGGMFAEPMRSGDPHVNYVDTDISQVFNLAAIGGARHRRAGIDKQFHGDGQRSKVDVVTVDSLLRDDGYPTGGEHSPEFGLAPSDFTSGALHPNGAGATPVQGLAIFSQGDMGGGGESLAFGGGGLGHAAEHTLASVPLLNTLFVQDTNNRVSGDTVVDRQLFDRDSIVVSGQKVVKVRRIPFSGHVYNLQTKSGLYIANGIIAHNCRCVLTYERADRGRTMAIIGGDHADSASD